MGKWFSDAHIGNLISVGHAVHGLGDTYVRRIQVSQDNTIIRDRAFSATQSIVSAMKFDFWSISIRLLRWFVRG